MNDEHTFNSALAGAIRARNPRWREDDVLQAEPIGVLPGGKRPDVLVHEPGASPVVLETEFLPARTVEADAKSRLGAKVLATGRSIDHAIAVRVPESLRRVGQHALPEAVATARYQYCLWSSEDTAVRWPRAGWIDGDADSLADLVESSALSERLVTRMLGVLEEGVSQSAERLRGACARRPDVLDGISESLHQTPGEQTTRMAMAILANALTFQTMIAGVRDVPGIEGLRGESGLISKRLTLREWRRILDDINYWPIFHVASRILSTIPEGISGDILSRLASVAEEIADSGVARSHDLSGRMFQRLITDRKFLATFYTRPAAATLLAELAVGRISVEWRNPDTLRSLRIADFACGTGTLLTAAYRAVARRHRRAGGDDRALHRAMIEDSLIATDIMPAATHLTTSILASANPTTLFEQTRVYTLPYGLTDIDRDQTFRIGALDLLDERSGISLFSTGIRRVTAAEADTEIGGGDLSEFSIPHGSLDLVIMNPPFTRPTNHEVADVPVPSFAGFETSKNEQQRMSALLARRRSGLDEPVGHGNAGLASNFLDLAHLKLKPGGALALVMPLVMVSGAAWADARRLLDTRYEDIVFVTISRGRPDEQSFSADTGMAEVLVIARKRQMSDSDRDVYTDVRTSADWVALRERPRTEMGAEETARQIRLATASEPRPETIRSGSEVIAGTIRAPVRAGGCASVGDLSVARTALALEAGTLALPGTRGDITVPTAALAEIGRKGPVHRDISGLNSDGTYRGPFDVAPTLVGDYPTYPMLWRHDAKQEQQLTVAPDSRGEVRPGMEDKAAAAWGSASHLHFNLDFRLNSQPLAACWTDERTMGGTAWPTITAHESAHEKALLLWANTTLGLLLFWWKGSRQQSGRARLTGMGLKDLPVLDVRTLDPPQLRIASAIFGKFSKRPLLPANEAYRDATRKALDAAVLIRILRLPESVLEPLDLLRKKWCAEPTVHGGKKTRPPGLVHE